MVRCVKIALNIKHCHGNKTISVIENESSLLCIFNEINIQNAQRICLDMPSKFKGIWKTKALTRMTSKTFFAMISCMLTCIPVVYLFIFFSYMVDIVETGSGIKSPLVLSYTFISNAIFLYFLWVIFHWLLRRGCMFEVENGCIYIVDTDMVDYANQKTIIRMLRLKGPAIIMSLFRARFKERGVSISMAYYKLTQLEELHVATACEAIGSLKLRSCESRACHIIVCDNHQPHQNIDILTEYLNRIGHKTFVSENMLISIWGSYERAECIQGKLKDCVIQLYLDL